MRTFCDDRLRGLGVARGRISRFPIDLRRRPYNTLALPCECVTITRSDWLVIIYGEHFTFATSVRYIDKLDEHAGEYLDSPVYVLGHVDGTTL